MTSAPAIWLREHVFSSVGGAPERTSKVIFPSCPLARHKDPFIEGAHLSTHFLLQLPGAF